ncbi:chorismate--pyruvate lyase family protein [Mangrovitalea sediminis]|uniref:chorismate--pyruvate lyase family protein n=1 Tax=Mangrovitalea sediminis TaxID=1982043 RepID=UPI000BE4DEE8|nr:chorismate lyase [Mangrovitalea sediminis]
MIPWPSGVMMAPLRYDENESVALMRNHATCRWLPHRRISAMHVPARVRDLLLSRGSLTRRLRHRSQHNFHVRIVREQFAQPTLDECRLLQLPTRELAWIREVELVGDGEVWVEARTVFPLHTLQGKHRRWRHLGSRPIGEILFREHGWQRGPLEVAIPSDVWQSGPFTRRSCFSNQDRQVLITEQFSAVLWQTRPGNPGQGQ